ncbi:MAG TPA: hypothetical protein VM580_19305 [Labilithrix sp.]|nr:hypothetical protein [Labilithrix sp.]
MKRALVTFLFASLWLACATQGDGDLRPFAECSAGQSRPCDCAGGSTGNQTCESDGIFTECSCTVPFADSGTTEPDMRLCSARDAGADAQPVKKCQVCDFDVPPSEGTVCPQAPSCGNGNLGAPADPQNRPDLTVYLKNGKVDATDGGETPAPSAPKGTCLDPQLRIRMKSLKVHKGSGAAYCIVEANDGLSSEASVTMKTSNLKDGDEFPFPVGQGILWGQRMPECTSNNLTLTYYCFKVVDNSAWSAALEAMGDVATTIGGSPGAGLGSYGWAFGLGAAAANATAAGIAAAQKDENRIQFQQTIPVSSLLDLTNGRQWSIRTKVKDGCGLIFCDRDYDWEIKLEAWGCADRLPNPN